MLDHILDTISQYTFLNFESFTLLLISLLISFLLGQLAALRGGSPLPLYWRFLVFLFGGVAQRLDKPGRSAGDLIFRGWLVTTFVLVFSLAIAWTVNHFAVSSFAYIPYIYVLVLVCVLVPGASWSVLSHTRKLLSDKKPSKPIAERSRTVLETALRADLSKTDEHSKARLAIGYVAWTLNRGVVAPVFWFAIGGLPAVILSSGIACAAYMMARHGHGRFGSFASLLDYLVGLVPAFITALLLSLAAVFTPTARMSDALAVLLGVKGVRASYAQGGMPVSVMSGALNITLGGPYKDSTGVLIKDSWIGPENSTAQVTARDINRAIYMSVISHLLILAGLVGGLVWISNL